MSDETITYDSLDDFVRDFRRLVSLATGEILVETHREIHRKTLARVKQRTPVDAGTMRDNWKSAGARGSSATTDTESVLATMGKVGKQVVTHIVNNAPQAIVIEKGRKKLRSYKRKAKGAGKATTVPSRMGGSAYAPRGVVKPTLEEIPKDVAGIFEVASRKAAKKAKSRARRAR